VYDAVCLSSGGLDSVVCLHLLRQQGIRALPLFINYGQINAIQEWQSLAENVREKGFDEPVVIDISMFGKIIRTGLTDRTKHVVEDAFTPNRNLLFLTLASAVGHSRGIFTIVLGFLHENTAIFPDQTDSFLATAKLAISESLGVEFQIICPLRDMTKSDVVRLSRQLGVHRSYSCHAGGEKPCGKCIACLEYSSED
jgi:7-cyano-7-deazaguanine synthase